MGKKEIEWSCLICLEKKYPMTLSPCGHGVCSECVEKIYKCPECRVDIVLKQPNYELGRLLGLDYVIEVNKDTEIVSKDEEVNTEESMDEIYEEENMVESMDEIYEEINTTEVNNVWNISSAIKMIDDDRKRVKYQHERRDYERKLRLYSSIITIIIVAVCLLVFFINLSMRYGGIYGIMVPIVLAVIFMIFGYIISRYTLERTCMKRPMDIVYKKMKISNV